MGPEAGKGAMVAGSQRDRVMAACGTKPGSAQDYPFGDEVAVFKVAGRMFALVSLGPAPAASASSAIPAWRPACAAVMRLSPRATTSISGTGTP
jgi:hypothetical protein